MSFIGKNDGPDIEEYIKWMKLKYPTTWKENMYIHLKDEALIWCNSLDLFKKIKIPDEEHERLLLNR